MKLSLKVKRYKDFWSVPEPYVSIQIDLNEKPFVYLRILENDPARLDYNIQIKGNKRSKHFPFLVWFLGKLNVILDVEGKEKNIYDIVYGIRELVNMNTDIQNVG